MILDELLLAIEVIGTTLGQVFAGQDGLEVIMGLCSAPTADIGLAPSSQKSLHAQGEEEARKFKWIMSEKAGRDLGDWAIRCWVREHWNGFLRERWMEHLQGSAYWAELDARDFGLLQRVFQDSPLIDEILRRLKFGEENLDIINWAIDKDISIGEVIDILETLDINSRRIECQFAKRLSNSRSG